MRMVKNLRGEGGTRLIHVSCAWGVADREKGGDKTGRGGFEKVVRRVSVWNPTGGVPIWGGRGKGPLC